MSFRKYGGTQFASSHNIVKSNVNTTDSFYVTKNVGQPNTYINFESDISGNVNIYGDLDVSGNLIVSGDADINGKLHVQENIDCSGNVNVDGDVTASKMFLTAPNHQLILIMKSYLSLM
jgi:cytoskeletal protein CcmA (bactofilin family)